MRLQDCNQCLGVTTIAVGYFLGVVCTHNRVHMHCKLVDGCELRRMSSVKGASQLPITYLDMQRDPIYFLLAVRPTKQMRF
jgi:hypothetical protein